MTASQSLAIIGNIVLDVLVHPMDRFPDPGRAVPASDVRLAPGGCGYHTAVTAAVLGVETRLFGSLGRDSFAGGYLAALFNARLVPRPLIDRFGATLARVLVASAAGSLACTGIGGEAGPRSVRQVQSLLLGACLPKIRRSCPGRSKRRAAPDGRAPRLRSGVSRGTGDQNT